MPDLKVVLVDVDGTLLVTGGAGRRTMNRIYAELWGVENAFDGTRADGKTDPAIFREILRRHGIQVDDESAAVARIQSRYERAFGAEMARSGARLMPGAREAMEALAGLDGIVMGLLTGNLEPTARIKVEHFGLGRLFPFGAYSSDSEDRRDLPPVAVARAEAHTGRTIGLGRHVVILGDTPRDVECALAHGCTAVGVAAARYTARDLEDAGAHAVLPDLTDTASVIRTVAGL